MSDVTYRIRIGRIVSETPVGMPSEQLADVLATELRAAFDGNAGGGDARGDNPSNLLAVRIARGIAGHVPPLPGERKP